MEKFFLLSVGCLTLFCSPITISAQNNIDSLPKDPLYDIWESLPPVRNKERDEETGYSYFGARYYDSDLSIWLSVDPLAQNSPHSSPYVYCNNNPIRLVDPDGRDWFENELTGQVYFNSAFGKDQAGIGGMEGDGWKWMGDNNMLGEVNDEFMANDQEFLSSDGQVGTFPLATDNGYEKGYDLNFGDNSKAFMDKQGYKSVVSEAFVYDKSTTESVWGQRYTTGEKITIAEKFAYAPKNYKLSSENREYLTGGKTTFTSTGWAGNAYRYRSQYNYSPNGKLSNNVFDGRSHKFYNSWNEYKGVNPAIEQYRPK